MAPINGGDPITTYKSWDGPPSIGFGFRSLLLVYLLVPLISGVKCCGKIQPNLPAISGVISAL